ncbi:MAG: NUDIX domain-containing protein [Candidatus Paceibacterota bacterium]
MNIKPKIRIRIAGIFIKEDKILLVKGKKYKELWTVGGKVDGNETDEECLRREIKEEIGVEITDIKFYKKYLTTSFYNPDIQMEERVYLISIKGAMKPNAEIESFVWFSKDDYYSKKYLMITHTEKELIPDLIKDNIW